MARKVMRGTVAAPRALFVMDRSGQPRRSDHVWTATHGGRVSGDMADTSPMLARRWPWGGRTGLCRYGRNDDDGCSERGSSQDERAFVESGFASLDVWVESLRRCVWALALLWKRDRAAATSATEQRDGEEDQRDDCAYTPDLCGQARHATKP